MRIQGAERGNNDKSYQLTDREISLLAGWKALAADRKDGSEDYYYYHHLDDRFPTARSTVNMYRPELFMHARSPHVLNVPQTPCFCDLLCSRVLLRWCSFLLRRVSFPEVSSFSDDVIQRLFKTFISILYRFSFRCEHNIEMSLISSRSFCFLKPWIKRLFLANNWCDHR